MFDFILSSNDETKKMPSISSKEKIYNNIKEFLNDPEHIGKGLLFEDGGGTWYYCNKKLIRFYKNSIDETCKICSIFMMPYDDVFIFDMENGSTFRLKYFDNNFRVYSGLTGDKGLVRGPKGVIWIEPLSIEEIFNYTL